MIAKREFGELELIILKTFEGRDKLTVKEVLSLLGGEDKYTTIMTVMNRMVEKARSKGNEMVCSINIGSSHLHQALLKE